MNNYYNTANKHLLYLMPKDAKVIVDIGCGSGALGAFYKTINPNCRYYGIEKESIPASLAKRIIDDVICADAAEVDIASSLNIDPGSIDVIIYGDSLEHMVDPWSIVKKNYEILSKDGVILASIPNVQHVSVLYNLMNGLWVYQDDGILDRTHLRFFTCTSAMELFTNAGASIHRIWGVPGKTIDQSVEDPDADDDRFLQSLLPGLESSRIDSKKFLALSKIGSFIICAGPKNSKYSQQCAENINIPF